ncbi:lyase activity protein [[Candida] boidinii]|uniref:Unnamed protein product n=1 Tax=Candida boidinii TaxID=5477 RepID=A0ACB5TP67_CANBO|nr:lyase activity protein [[Candida] boidinii]GME92410.1 unnamed protein product [[Candida] boidinii]
MAPVALNPQVSEEISSAAKITFGKFLFQRIKSLGVDSIFGVPGDFNLKLLDYLYEIEGLNWVGCCNELNSAYAADGYSRASNKLGVLVTTFGVGELSAMNGVSGAFAESVPVLHIVGTSTRKQKQAKSALHHLVPNASCFKEPDHYVYEKMVAGTISCHVESLFDLDTACDQVDNLIKEILIKKRPGYLFIPSDFSDELIDPSNLISNPGSNLYPSPIFTNQTDKIVDEILHKIYNSKFPTILGDIFVDRYQLVDELRKFAEISKFPSFSTYMGKSILKENSDKYIGDFLGVESNTHVRDIMLKSDCILHIGGFLNEINTGHETLYNDIDSDSVVFLHPEYIKIGNGEIYYEPFMNVLPLLLERFESSKVDYSNIKDISYKPEYNAIPEPSKDEIKTPISQGFVLKSLQNFIQPNDLVVCDTGSFMFGLPDLRLPEGARLIGQHFYLSIGYGMPASFGASIAVRDMKLQALANNTEKKFERVVLIQGDGAAELTIQELSNFMYHEDLNPAIIILNNNGYTVERIINGPTMSYNDIRSGWKWSKLLSVLGDENCLRHDSHEIVERDDLVKHFNEFNKDKDNNKVKFAEIILDQFDVPWRLKFMTKRN